MTRIRRLLLLCAVLLGACATDPRPAVQRPTAADVIAAGTAQGPVHWGGQIVAVTNLRDRTLVEVLALPLDRSGRPRLSAKPQGRFLVRRAGFLEPREYVVNRLLSVRGELDGFLSGKVGDAPYRFPVVSGDELILWPQQGQYGYGGAPRINFGFGVSNHGGGVGVGVGF